MAALSLKKIAEHVSGTVLGDGAVLVDRIDSLTDATSNAISFLANPKYTKELQTTHAGAVLVSKNISESATNLIQVDNPDLAFDQVVRLLMPPPPQPEVGVHPTATVAADAILGAKVAIGAGVVIEAGVKIGARTIIHPNVSIGANSQLGEGCILYSGVVLYHENILGNRVIIHANAVIGSDGFGYAWDGKRHCKSPQIGHVEIEDEVEIGASTTIDRARFGRTLIQSGTKIDNQIQIAHNVSIGKNCALAACTGISGSTRVGNGVLMGGLIGIAGHLTIGDGVRLGAGTGVTKDVPAGEVWLGAPGRPASEKNQEWAHARKLPKLVRRIRELEQQLAKMQEQLERLDRK